MPPRLPILTSREVIRALERAGFFVHHFSGSHAQLKLPAKPGFRVTVPQHSKDLPPFILRSILRQTGLSAEEFLKLL
ncbi:MAG: type II toxin-antitoxin system HicA family toxin [Candidatus Binatales bacterium]